MSLVLDENYTEKSIVIFGDTDALIRHSTEILNKGGYQNHALRPAQLNGPKRSGFVFPKTKLSDVRDLVQRLNSGAVATPSSTTVAPSRAVVSQVATTTSSTDTLVKNLSARLEAVESELQALRKLVLGGKGVATTPTVASVASAGDDEDGGEDMEDEPVVKSLIKRAVKRN